MSREAVVQTAGSAAGNRSLLRRMNSLGILTAILEEPQILRQLTVRSGLSRTAVDAVVTDLVAMGWLGPHEGASVGRLGRPAAAYRIPEHVGRFLSIDIGANHIYSVVSDLAGRLIGYLSAQLEESTEATDRVDAALGVADRLLDSLGLDRDAIWLVTIGSPGVISADGVVTYFGGTGMPGWIGLDLRERFGREFAAAVLVEGDVALGAHAELRIGAARGYSDVVYVLCGVRTSGASVVNGKVHRGAHGAAGIVGEMPELRWAELNELYGTDVLPTPRPSRERIFELARSGDPAAIAAVTEFADDLAAGAAAMTLALDPQLLVIGGGSSPAADVFLPRFEETLRAICPLPPQVVASKLGSEAVAMGGISLAAERLAEVLEHAVRDRDAFPSPAETLELLRA